MGLRWPAGCLVAKFCIQTTTYQYVREIDVVGIFMSAEL